MLDTDGVTCLGTRGQLGWEVGKQTPIGGDHRVQSEMKEAKRALWVQWEVRDGMREGSGGQKRVS